MTKRDHKPRTRPNAKIGDRYGDLEVVGPPIAGATGTYYPCLCHSCGDPTVLRWALRTSQQTCGCRKGHHTHGGRQTRLYSIWSNMYDRCLREKCPAYRHYGGRGITVCDEWREFASFRTWAESAGYADDLTIDRIDNDGDYEPSNCHWVPMKVQSRNRRNNLVLSWGDESKTLIEWVEDPRCVVKYMTAYNRVTRSGWSIERALTTPAGSVR